jgi:peptidoglycan hydrolase CwlO-like protein
LSYSKALLFAICIGIMASAVTRYRVAKNYGRDFCEAMMKGADAEIRHQLEINQRMQDRIGEQNRRILKMQDRIGEQNRRILKMQNELGKYYGKSVECEDD